MRQGCPSVVHEQPAPESKGTWELRQPPFHPGHLPEDTGPTEVPTNHGSRISKEPVAATAKRAHTVATRDGIFL